jgi:colicin V production protein-like protein
MNVKDCITVLKVKKYFVNNIPLKPLTYMILIPIILYNSSFVIFCVKPALTFSHKNKLFGLVFYTTKGVFRD